jgi:hypothetical protein
MDHRHARLPPLAPHLWAAAQLQHASMLPWIDRLFGSHYLPKVWPSRYGIPEPMAASLAGQVVQPFQAQRGAATTADATETESVTPVG